MLLPDKFMRSLLSYETSLQGVYVLPDSLLSYQTSLQGVYCLTRLVYKEFTVLPD